MAKFGIALGSGPRGRGFESRHSDQQKSVFCLKTKGAFLNDVFRCAERDVCFASDVHFVRDVRLRRVSGTHHITLRQSRNTSLFAKQTTSLAPTAQTSLYNSNLIWYFKKEVGDVLCLNQNFVISLWISLYKS